MLRPPPRDDIAGLIERLRAYEGRNFETTACYNGTRDEAALTAALAVDRMVLVPKEPTMAMLAAGQRAWINDHLKRSSTLYRAMLAAASTGDSQTKDSEL